MEYRHAPHLRREQADLDSKSRVTRGAFTNRNPHHPLTSRHRGRYLSLLGTTGRGASALTGHHIATHLLLVLAQPHKELPIAVAALRGRSFTPQKLYDPFGGFLPELPVAGGNRRPFFHRGGSSTSNRFEFLFNHFRGFDANPGPLTDGGAERTDGIDRWGRMECQMTSMISKSAVS